MPVDANQPKLLEAIRYWFEDEPPVQSMDWRITRQVSKGHGRLEQRELMASDELREFCQQTLGWTTVEQVMRLDRHVTYLSTGQQTHETVYAITSLTPEQADAATLLRYWRGHWQIENRLHWVRDVLMGEDACRVRTGAAPQVLAALRNAAVSLVRAFGFESLTQAQYHLRANLHQSISFVCGTLI